jgi:hypothetical protein
MTKDSKKRQVDSYLKQRLERLVKAAQKALPRDEQLAKLSNAEIGKIADSIAEKWYNSFTSREDSKSRH